MESSSEESLGEPETSIQPEAIVQIQQMSRWNNLLHLSPLYAVETDIQRTEMTPWDTLADIIEGSTFGGDPQMVDKAFSERRKEHPDLRHITKEHRGNLSKEV